MKNIIRQIYYINKIQSVSGCQNNQTAGPISVKFGRKAQLNHVGKIAIVYISNPAPGGAGGLKTLKAEGNTKQNCLQNKNV